MSKREREATRLRFYDDLSHDEIARKLDVANGTVKATLSHARSHLRNKLLPLQHLWLRDDI